MKLEVGESLFYSWCRHVKKCQVVQTNWKPSPGWMLYNADKIESLKRVVEKHYPKEYGNIFGKKDTKVQIIFKHTKMDVLGLSLSGTKTKVYAIDVAFHKGGLGYTSNGSPNNEVKVVQKILRMALCVYGYFNTTKGEIIFASPKINPSVWKVLEPCKSRISELFKNNGLDFKVQIIANDEFKEKIMEPVKEVASKIHDTSELFLRAYELLKRCQ